MYRSQDIVVNKDKVNVTLHLADGELQGMIYVGPQQRVFDLLNKSDQFVPLETAGTMKFVNKAAITMLEADDQERMTMKPERRALGGAIA